uniref:Zgc:154093 n=1 Tax=Echeneis naucrates TaxID=173247 RepID=A0A665TUW4_ECHNA
MPAKTPIYLKTTTPKKGRKLKLREVLSGDMISPPLGDVRHSAHVGPEGEGDMFGDVGFLQGKIDMLPSLSRTQSGHACSQSAERCLEEGFANRQDPHSYASKGFHYQHCSTGLMKNTISMPVFIAHEQAPPKPPRLHLDDPSLPSQQNSFLLQQQQANSLGQADHHRHQHPNLSLCENSVVGRLVSEPYRDISLSPAIHQPFPSSGSFSEVSSEDSIESPFAAFHPTDSLVGLDLDLGPSILEDVLSIMDRYKTSSENSPLAASGFQVLT